MIASDLEIAWLAGLLEGEGCFTLSTSPRRPNNDQQCIPKVTLQMTDRDVVETAAALMRTRTGSSARVIEQSQMPKSDKPIYRFQLCGPQVIPLLRELLPHMHLRRRERIESILQDRSLFDAARA